MKMRRADRVVTDPAEIRGIVSRCKVCRLAMQDEEGLYLIPLSFGARWEGDKLTLCFHSAGEGRKIAALRRDPRAAFEMDCGWQLTGQGDVGCSYSCLFSSVTGRGTVRFLETAAEKTAALQTIMRQQTGKEFCFTDKMVENVTVFTLEAEVCTAKANRPRG